MTDIKYLVDAKHALQSFIDHVKQKMHVHNPIDPLLKQNYVLKNYCIARNKYRKL